MVSMTEKNEAKAAVWILIVASNKNQKKWRVRDGEGM